jgi:hypothetical protein
MPISAMERTAVSMSGENSSVMAAMGKSMGKDIIAVSHQLSAVCLFW